jgi:NAD kinase
LKEFNTLNLSLQDRRYLARYIQDEKLKVYHPTDCHPLFLSEDKIETVSNFHMTNNLCRIASQVVVGGENWALMMALETIIKMKIPVIPICYEYDGFLMLTEIDSCDESLNQLNEHLQPLLKLANLFPMEFEQKPI